MNGLRSAGHVEALGANAREMQRDTEIKDASVVSTTEQHCGADLDPTVVWLTRQAGWNSTHCSVRADDLTQSWMLRIREDHACSRNYESKTSQAPS